mgnify:FL=1
MVLLPSNLSRFFHRVPSGPAKRRTPLEWMPFRVWKLVIITFFVGLVFLGGFHFYLWRAVNETAQLDAIEGERATPPRADLVRAQELLQGKEDEYKALLLTRPVVIDPSR